MKELLKTIVSGLVQKPEDVSVDEEFLPDDNMTLYKLTVSEEDMGRVIGKQGRIAKAIRKLMRAAANKENVKVQVKIG